MVQNYHAGVTAILIAAVYDRGICTAPNRGVVHTRNQDPHGPSIVWLSGDSDLGSHESRRVRTCSVVGINGAAVLVKSKRRGLRDATMRAELEASFYTGMHGLGYINVLNELEFWQCGAAVFTACCTLTVLPISNSVMGACLFSRRTSMQRSDSC